jgi:Cu-Zn family superoxide dismutase
LTGAIENVLAFTKGDFSDANNDLMHEHDQRCGWGTSNEQGGRVGDGSCHCVTEASTCAILQGTIGGRPMYSIRTLAAIVMPLILVGCVGVPIVLGETSVTTTLIRFDNERIGKVRMTAASNGVMMHIDAAGLPPGIHGAHVHAVGRCDRADFSTAGPHWDLSGRAHGRANPAGPHDGDLGNVSVGADGRLAVSLLISDAVLPLKGAKGGGKVMMDADGAALVIHAAADDERTDPSGNSGKRIACAPLAAPLQP